MNDNRIAELLNLAAAEGITLPMSPEEIFALEDDGHTLDLSTGEIIIDGANARYELTTASPAVVHVWELLEGA